MDGLERIYDTGVGYAKDTYYPTSIRHFIFIAAYVAITFYVTDYFINFRLFRWIYIGTIIVILITLFNGPQKKVDAHSPYLFRIGEFPM